MLNKKQKLLFVSTICIIFLLAVITVWVLYDDNNPSNWSPWFAFFRSKDCVLTHNTYTNVCFLTGTRSPNFPTKNNDSTQNMYVVIASLNLYEESTRSGGQKKPLNQDDWNCRFGNTQKPVDIQVYKPQRGDVFECWPVVPLEDDVLIGSLE